MMAFHFAKREGRKRPHLRVSVLGVLIAVEHVYKKTQRKRVTYARERQYGPAARPAMRRL